MSLAGSTLAAIQQAGAAVYAADADLKQVVQTHAARVTAAMAANPFGLGNDALFENWKTLARLSQSMTAIEAELKKNLFCGRRCGGPRWACRDRAARIGRANSLDCDRCRGEVRHPGRHAGSPS